MDAEARTGSRVLAHVGVRGATYRELLTATQLAPEALDAALKALRGSRLLVSREGRWWQPHTLPRLPGDDDEPGTMTSKSHAALAAAARWERQQKQQHAPTGKRWCKHRDHYVWENEFRVHGRGMESSCRECEREINRERNAKRRHRTATATGRKVRSKDELIAAMHQAKTARWAEALAMRVRGATYVEIGRFYSMDPSSARSLVAMARRWDAKGRP